jgi:hypothetical protein
MQCNLGTCGRHFRKRWHADGNVVSDAVSFDNCLIRALCQQSSSKMRNHSEVLYGSQRLVPSRQNSDARFRPSRRRPAVGTAGRMPALRIQK